MKIATTIGDLRHYCTSPAHAVRCFEGTGFRHIDYSFYTDAWNEKPILQDNWMQTVVDASKAAEQLGFDFVQAHSPGNNFLSPDDDFDQVVLANIRSIEACGYLGIRNIVVHSGFSESYQYPMDKEAYFEANRKFYESLYPAMEKNNVHVLIENSADANMRGQYFPMSGQDLVDFVNYLGHPLLGACWDVGHANLQNPAQYADIVTLGNILGAVHIQDNFGKQDDHIAPFMGTLDLDAVLCGLLDNGFVDRGGVFTFESDNIICRGLSWPNKRKPTEDRPEKLLHPSLELRRAALSFLYQIGCEILKTYEIPIE